jgi:hypothetical protein
MLAAILVNIDEAIDDWRNADDDERRRDEDDLQEIVKRLAIQMYQGTI